MFDILGVIDLRNGLAVRAHGGHRDRYVPIDHVAGEPIPRGDARALAEQYLKRFGLSQQYVADLDAIERRVPQHEAIRSIRSTGASIWLDGGIASPQEAACGMKSGADRVIVGLETLPSFEVLESICESAGPRVVFSLDLRDGTPLTTARDVEQDSPEGLAARAVAAGACAVIVLDLARVGSGSGIDLQVLARVRASVPSVPLYAGGGVRNVENLEDLQRAGCDGALIASALLDGRITRRDIHLHLGLVPTPGTSFL